MKKIFDFSKLSKTVQGHLIDSDLPEENKQSDIQDFNSCTPSTVFDYYLNQIGIYGFSAQIEDAYKEIQNAEISVHNFKLTTYEIELLREMMARARLDIKDYSKFLALRAGQEHTNCENRFEESHRISEMFDKILNPKSESEIKNEK